MALASDEFYEENQIKKIVYKDRLGYAIVYYNPKRDYLADPSKNEVKCGHERHRLLGTLMNEERDEEFYREIEAMVRRLEREDADKEIRKICAKVEDMFSQVEQDDLKNREILNFRVKQQIKGKSADEICDILVADVLNHTKAIYHPKEHRCTSSYSVKKEIAQEFLPPKQPHVYQRVEKVLDQIMPSEIHRRSYIRLLDNIQNDITHLKRRCKEKIDFAY